MNAIPWCAARTAARPLAVPAAALAVLAATAPQAAAHTELDTSSPGTNATLAGPPPRVTLTFSDEMTQKYAKVAVTGPDGKPASDGAPQVDGRTVTLPLDAGSPAGRYTVGYRVVSADGHPVSGSYTFTVKETVSPSASPQKAQAAGSPTPRADDKPATEGSDGQTAGTQVAALAGAGALVLAAAGGGMYVMRRKRAGHGD
ncbi:copper resistance protein CopC [Streptomyces scabiei]|uniref:copper resistance CopC family protein n=1 Tax=Streptomyces scabiei TaxID=1930 RepID=UPI0029B8C74B|nr:copper resistance protein CopC [Streptomyces scabiei]MDX3521986.1 copper resistance protein CopC [Streptomyces scabiei]